MTGGQFYFIITCGTLILITLIKSISAITVAGKQEDTNTLLMSLRNELTIVDRIACSTYRKVFGTPAKHDSEFKQQN